MKANELRKLDKEALIRLLISQNARIKKLVYSNHNKSQRLRTYQRRVRKLALDVLYFFEHPYSTSSTKRKAVKGRITDRLRRGEELLMRSDDDLQV